VVIDEEQFNGLNLWMQKQNNYNERLFLKGSLVNKKQWKNAGFQEDSKWNFGKFSVEFNKLKMTLILTGSWVDSNSKEKYGASIACQVTLPTSKGW